MTKGLIENTEENRKKLKTMEERKNKRTKNFENDPRKR